MDKPIGKLSEEERQQFLSFEARHKAIDAMFHGGILKVGTEIVEFEKDNVVGNLGKGEYVNISMEDNGCGMEQKTIERLFDPYFTTKKKGSGLGLPVSYNIVKAHGGYIKVTSKPGEGAKFCVYLPLFKGRLKGKNAAEDIVMGHGSVLIMDDEEDIAKATVKMLGKLGYDAEYCLSSSEAVRMYRNKMGVGRPYSVVILDLTVPGDAGAGQIISELMENTWT